MLVRGHLVEPADLLLRFPVQLRCFVPRSGSRVHSGPHLCYLLLVVSEIISTHAFLSNEGIKDPHTQALVLVEVVSFQIENRNLLIRFDFPDKMKISLSIHRYPS